MQCLNRFSFFYPSYLCSFELREKVVSERSQSSEGTVLLHNQCVTRYLKGGERGGEKGGRRGEKGGEKGGRRGEGRGKRRRKRGKEKEEEKKEEGERGERMERGK